MDTLQRSISLAFNENEIEPGLHICHIYGSETERHAILAEYICNGISAAEQTVCFSDIENRQSFSMIFHEKDLKINELTSRNLFVYAQAKDVYFSNGIFNVPGLIASLRDLARNAGLNNFEGTRVIGEMPVEVEQVAGIEKIIDYENKVSKLLKTHPIKAICQYNAATFNGASLMEILKVHPYILIQSAIVSNPFYTEATT